MKILITLSQLTLIAMVSASAAVCITDDCFLCIQSGEVEDLGDTYCKGVKYDDLQTTLGECWVGSSKEAVAGQSGRTGITDNNPACSVSVSVTQVVLDENDECVTTEIPLPPGFDVLNRNCPKFVPDPNSQSCWEPT